MQEVSPVFPVIFLLIFIVLGIVTFGLWLWSLIHCAMNKQLSDTNRIVGILLIVLLGILGSLIYLFLPREVART
ncbi:PLDc N-terminal domain-containing protein [Coraliomargarita parva]|uniref:PLDc N-terminal domain-containing protein n=1 Tax=Coraliomargarita parva TaxID=3014050 RepID=UPI0022B4649D|nr:PLDc N-terminal domain-containing protein [Coraliomargarita parva]